MNSKAWAWLVAAVVVIGGLVWWGTAHKAAAPAVGDTYKVGVILPLTGDAAVYGEPLNKVVHIAADEINAAGGVDGKLLQLIVEDGKCNGQDAANATQKLVNVDKTQVVIGGFCSSESLAAVPIAAAAKVAMISPGSSSPKLTNVSSYFVRNYPSDSTQGKVLADIAYNGKGWRKVGFIQEQTDYAQGVYQAFKDEFEKLGGATTNEAFPTENTDFRSIVSKVKSENPDAVFLSMQTPAVMGHVMTQMQQLGWRPHLMAADVLPGDPATVSQYAKFLEGALVAEFGVDKTNKKFAAMIASYKAKYGEEPPYQSYAQTVYDSVYLVADAMKAVGYDGTKIADWLHNDVKNWQGAAGSVTIQSNGDPATGHRPEIITGGKVAPYTK